MVFTKTIRIKDKVFSKDDIVALWAFISQQSKTQYAGETTISIRNKDQDVSSSSDDVFSTSNFIKKPIESIRIYYRSKDWTSKIELTIAVETSYLFVRSEVVVAGGAEEWVDSCSEKIRDILNDVKGSAWMTPIVHKGGMVVLGGGLGAIMMLVFTSFVLPLIKTVTDILWLRFVLTIGYFGCAGWFFWQLMKVDEFFPVVDIDIGGTHHSGQQRLAKMIWGLISSIVLPIIIGLWINRCSSSEKRNEISVPLGANITNTVKAAVGTR